MSTVEFTTIRIDACAAPTRMHRRALLAGVVVSFCLHAVAAAALVVVPYLLWMWMFGKSMLNEPQITIVATVEEEKPAEPPQVVQVTADIGAAREVPIEEVVNRRIDEAKQRPDQDNQDEFAEQARRLEQISDAESVDAMADKFHSWLGTQPRATEPATQETVGPFDFDSAQIHEIKREKREDGTWKYVCVLIDAEGRTIETELDDEEGERQYQTFQRLKQFPLADKVYREIAMPLLDKLLQRGE